MSTEEDVQALLLKAEESLSAAAADLDAGRYNACASRCYYSCFQVAVAALLRAGIRPAGSQRRWSHEFVQSQFAGQLVVRRRIYPSVLRDVLPRLSTLRRIADYDTAPASAVRTIRAFRDAREFVKAVRVSGGGL